MTRPLCLAPLLCLMATSAFANPFSNMQLPMVSAGMLPVNSAATASDPKGVLDVIGFWSLTQSSSIGTVTFQFYFGSNGSHETRAFADIGDETFRLHGFGNWTLKGDSVTLTIDPARCLNDSGARPVPCEDTEEPWTLYLEEIDGVKSLVDKEDGDETVIAEYVGPQRQFTLPSLITPVAIGRSPRGGSSQGGRGLVLTGFAGGEASTHGGFDITGRAAVRPTAAMPRVPLNYYKLR